MPRPELNIEIDRLLQQNLTGTLAEVTMGEAVDEREDALKAVAKSLDRDAVEELIGEDAEGVVLLISKAQRVRIT